MTRGAPLVSIVTPVYNGGAYLRQCLDSILDQDYAAWEAVLVDNCSTDDTPQILAEYAAREPRLRVVRNPELLPMIANHNLALQLMSLDSVYCKILHADDWLAPSCLRRMVEVAERHPKVGVVGALTRWGERTEAGGLPRSAQSFDGREIARRTLLGEIYPFWSPTCLLVRSDIVRSRGDFYPSAELHTDVQACYEMLAAYDFGFVHDVLTFVRTHDDSMTSAQAKPLNRLMASNLELLHTYGPKFLDPRELRDRFEFLLARYYAFLGRSRFERRDARFWDFHREALGRCGLTLDMSRVARCSRVEFLRRPRASLRRLARAVLGQGR